MVSWESERGKALGTKGRGVGQTGRSGGRGELRLTD
jgi:hypothetical protein